MIRKTEHESATRMAERLSVALRKPWRLNVPRSPTDKSNPSSLGNGTIGVFGDDVGRLIGILLES